MGNTVVMAEGVDINAKFMKRGLIGKICLTILVELSDTWICRPVVNPMKLFTP